jgi:hypothetical protein
VALIRTDVSEDRIASIFSVHECEQVTERSCKLLCRQRLVGVSYYSFLLEAESIPGTILRLKELDQLKNPMISSGIDLPACRIVPQPPTGCNRVLKYNIIYT